MRHKEASYEPTRERRDIESGRANKDAPEGTPEGKDRWIGTGILGGTVAGIAMTLVAMAWMALAGQGFWKPLDVIASALLGKSAINPGLQMVPELVGMTTRLALSALFGLVFSFFVSRTPLRAGGIIRAGIIYGLWLWIVDMFVDTLLIPAGMSLAPAPLIVVVHLVYGLVLGLVAAPRPKTGKAERGGSRE